MFKWGFGLILCTPMMVLANIPFDHQDVVGDWLCIAKDGDSVSTAIMRYHADGSATEMIESKYRNLSYNDIEMAILKYQWRLEGNRLYMSDYQLPKYRYYYKTDGMLIQSDEATIDEMKADLLSSINKDGNWHYMIFDGKDNHQAVFEDGYSADCQRLK